MVKVDKIKTPIAIVIILILSTLIYLTYDGYKKTILNQQLQNMLGNSRSIARSIELFVNDTVNTMKVVTLDKDFIKEVKELDQNKTSLNYKKKLETYYDAGGEEIDSVYYIDTSGNIIIRYPQTLDNVNEGVLEDIKTALSKKETYIGNAYYNKDKNYFTLNIYEPIFDGKNFIGMFCSAINLDIIYDKLIAPVKVGEKGYALVKDQKGIIIMHTVKEQVGMDVIESRKQVYPDLDYNELEKLIDEQLKGNEGTAIYHSYWWGDNVLKKARKLNAYTPVNLGEHFWIIALTMSYDEIQGPINGFLIKIVGIVSLIIIIIYFFVTTLLRMKKNKEELEDETRYLKMLNETSEQLRKKEAELNHAHKLKMIGTLTGGIAHDINNLLTPILGYSELLLMQIPEGEEYHDELNEVYKASRKGKDLVEQLLIFSRKDSGITKTEPIDIKEVTKDTIKLVKAVKPKDIIIKESIEEVDGYVNANFTQLHQVIFNLCTNAYQAIKDKDGVLEIGLCTISREEARKDTGKLAVGKNYALLTISDNGCGMSEETKLRIFEPFFTTKTLSEGTGLGLFVVQSIIDKYGGSITVSSKKDVGSTFKVYFPLSEKKIKANKKVTFNNSSGIRKRILVVDDNKDILKVLKNGLKHEGYLVETETDSAKALEGFKKNPHEADLIITDFMMPNLKGNELAAAIKAVRKDIKIVLMTGYMDENIEAMDYSEDIDEYVLKPIELNKLYQVISRLL
ncbi:sensor histidine kinase [Clostridium rhizosphaerae]|uniref:sensor histidine kinase n=1 Tax=Clostridium rhizosphaerae TaxID=2803861 RepID=UPI001FAFA84E|nr:sensor histidine kinase [Clostridium rhizosphaerae]